MDHITGKNENIVNEILRSKKIAAGQLINYALFLELYEPYKEEVKETEFADMLGITYGNYMNMKNRGTRTKVLRSRTKEITEERKEEIIEELIKSNKIKANQLIDYEEFKELYEEYKEEVKETEFAYILGITYGNYMNMKNRGARTKVLKSRAKEISEERKEEIIEELIKSNKIRVGQSISYEELKELCKPYKEEVKEAEFADMLGITYSNYMSMKKRGQRAKVLKSRIKEITEDRKEEIIEELIKSNKIKGNQSIDYEEFKEIYEEYKEEVKETEFSAILGITYFNYMNMKNGGTRAKVLKSRAKEITEDRKEQIIEELIKSNKIRVGQSISYEELKALYNPYKEEVKETEFSAILGITYSNYMSMKKRGTRAKVLKSRAKEITEDRKEEIIEELIKSNKIKGNQLIDYEEFKEIYEEYKEEVKETEFSAILGITYSNYMSMKNGGTRAKVLKSRAKEISEERKEEIIEELIKSNKIRVGQSISYEELKELCKPYKEEVKEAEFADMLGITYSNYMSMKKRGQRAKVLKSRIKEITEDRKEEIIEELIKSNKIKANQLIDYEEFKELCKPYKEEVKETEFADILGITNYNYKNMKNRGGRTKVLKSRAKEISEERKEEIIEELIKSNKIRVGQSISYEELKALYNPYKEEVKETEFSAILGITYSNYMSMKKRGTRAKVLKSRAKEITEDRKEEIIEELIKSNKIKGNQLIDYEEFKEIYEEYKEEVKETEFSAILGITYSNYMSIKNKGTRAKVLKSRAKEITEDRKEEIIEELIKSNKIRVGQSISYEELKALYNPYKEEVKETEFSAILGITYSNYMYMKSGGTRAKVWDYRDKRKIDRIRYILEQERKYYSSEEIENICNKFQVNKETLLKSICCGGRDTNLIQYIELLKSKGKIWIGKVKCSRKFTELHSESILKYAQQISRSKCKRYGCKNLQEEVAGQSVVYVLEQCGDIEKNFEEDDKIARERIFSRINSFIKYSCLKEIRRPKENGLNRKIEYKGDQKEVNILDVIEDKSQNIQDKVEEKILNEIKKEQEINPEEACIELLRLNVEAGLNREEALTKTGEVLGISPEEMLKSMQKYMLEQKRVRKTSSGKFVVGEGDER